MAIKTPRNGEAYDDWVAESIYNGEFDEAVAARFDRLITEERVVTQVVRIHRICTKPGKKMRIMKAIKIALRAYAEIVLVACYIALIFTFFSAYIKPDKTVLIAIDAFGEAASELILLVFAMPLIMLHFKENIQRLTKGED